MCMKCFKAYDIRGRVPDELNADIAYRIGRAFARTVGEGEVVVGFDIRLDSPTFAAEVARGLVDEGRGVIDIGLCGTEEVYFQTAHRGVAGGIMVTASHNPIDYNGMKLVREGARPISGDTGLREIERMVEENAFGEAGPTRGSVRVDHDKSAYIAHLLSYIDVPALRPLKIVVNAGNGGAGAIVDLLEPYLPFTFVRVNHEPDGTFPNGIPNPLLPENRDATAKAVIASGADLGIAWDGDFDRCFLFDAQGGFIEGYYIVGLLAAQLLEKHPGSKIIHDPRLTWNTVDMVAAAGGMAVESKTGHAFIKERMRSEDAVYGGEMSAHHYFRDFAYCDSGMIPWLLVAERIGKTGTSLTDMLVERMAAYPCSGEINFRVDDAPTTVARIVDHYRAAAESIEHIDGVSMSFGNWRFNLRSSNTEPLLRLNVEARGDTHLMESRTAELRSLIGGKPA
ncbi:phosphomannomutase [Luteibacter rhizovicinus DSM 16549]|uniref:phosphomannomutase n=2 Tax=Luteibacter rhizovicinus TaxID=242606 RepID=A0A0G9H9J2_9GAMM|nr:phosphomannomutase/phosphoglucomutase [Luteibacter rhizovicinus]APG06496.1 phosphomannomutase [Luteibacter rhizovicinus DSM 16549]KLD66263.1 phosphomannomutase [Luteibacter rhizovicinus DSM 16549]KLD79085.1 phosphomannomutase [Xanthomonas hyacinthi DSM 19077]